MQTLKQRRWLQTLIALMLTGLPAAHAQEAVTAPLFSVTLDDAQDSVTSALIADGVADTLKAEIISTRQPLLYQYKQPLDIQVKTLKSNEAEHTWSANLLFSHAGEVISAMPVSGRYEETVRVPILTQRLSHGETITLNEIAIKEFSRSRVRQDVIMTEEELVGKTPKRTISISRPIRADEVQAPEVVKKGSMVKMTYQTPYMQISTSGEALQDGAMGETIRLRNRDSNTTIYATVTSADEVIVTNTSRDRAQPHDRPAPARVRPIASRR